MYLIIYYKSGNITYQDYTDNLDEAMQKQHELVSDNSVIMSSIVSDNDTQLMTLMNES